MAITSADTNLWEALAGRAPGRPTGPDDPDLWRAVVQRLNPVRARPVLRPAIEQAHLTSLRGQPYVMLRSPDEAASYVRLSPEEVSLASRMDGSRTVAQLVREFVQISGRLAPDQVTRVVADLAANRMLAELPIDAFRRVESVRRRSWAGRMGHGLLAAARGKRVVLASFDKPAGWLYRCGGRLLFTRPAALLIALLTLVGLYLFGRTWLGGSEQLFLSSGSYAAGGLVLLGLNVFALLAHEMGHALGVKHAGRRVPAIGFLFYFGIPSAFVDTTDVWMAGRRARLITTAAGPLSALALAGTVQLIAAFVPELSPLAFRLAFVWYLNALFNLNPLMALDGYYLAMDWLEIANLRRRGMTFLVGAIRRRRIGWKRLNRENRYVAMYGVTSALWLIVFMSFSVRMWRDRVAGLVTGLWHLGWASRLLLIVFVVGLAAPLVAALLGWGGRRIRARRERRAERERTADEPVRLAALRSSRLARLPAEALTALAREAKWSRPSTGSEVVAADAAVRDVLVVTEGALEGRRPGDPPGTVRRRAHGGEIVGITPALAGVPSPLAWASTGTRLLEIPAAIFHRVVGPLVGGPPVDRAEGEAVIGAAPALASLPDEEREALLRRMRPLDVPPGKTITLKDPDNGAVVESGTLLGVDGREHHRGDVLAPEDAEHPVHAMSRTPVRLWGLPRLTELTLFGGSSEGCANRSPGAGAHGDEGYAPLLASPAPPHPPPPSGEDPDDRLVSWFRRFLILLLLLAMLSILVAARPATGWVEIPADHAVLSVRVGPVEVTRDGEAHGFGAGDTLTVSRFDVVALGRRSVVDLTFAGGATQVLCPNTRVEMGSIRRDTVRRGGFFESASVRPSATIHLQAGRILADTTMERGSFLPLALEIEIGQHVVATDGETSFTVSPSAVALRAGEVTLDGDLLTPVTQASACDFLGVVSDSGTFGPIGEGATAAKTVPGASPSKIRKTGKSPARSRGSDAKPGSDAATASGLKQASADGFGGSTSEPSPQTRPKSSPSSEPSQEPKPRPTPTESPSFTVSCNPDHISGEPGTNSERTMCTVTPSGGFTGDVQLSCSGLPDGTGCVWSNGTGAVEIRDGPASLGMQVRIGPRVPPGDYRFTVEASGGGIRDLTSLVLTVV
ncbi:MAG: cyclic nucleotide-binding protein [Actinomycetota bacterium]|nr:cyclic nucleotide-binding protein [Actinomycetota bacterium]